VNRRSTLAEALGRSGDGEGKPSPPPVPFALPRPGRRATLRHEERATGDIPRDARIFIVAAIILWSLVALEVVVLASSGV
jgi:hypothetical protein